MTITILIIVNVFTAIAIIGLTLMQQSKGDMGSAFGGGSSQSMFGSRGSANFLSRSTSFMCLAFFVSSLALAYVYAQRADSSSVIDGDSVIEQTINVDEITPAENGVPTIPGVENLPEVPSESDLPSIPDAANNAVEAVEEVGQDAVEAVQDAAGEVIDAAESAVEEVPEVPE